MNRDLAKQLNTEVAAALQAVATRHGLVVNVRGGKYGPVTGLFAPKIEFTSPDSAQREFERYAPMYGLNPTDFGKRVTGPNGTYTIVGLNPRAHRAPILGEKNGKLFKLPVALAKASLDLA